MATLLATMVLVGLAMLGLGLGPVLGRSPVEGSCGAGGRCSCRGGESCPHEDGAGSAALAARATGHAEGTR